MYNLGESLKLMYNLKHVILNIRVNNLGANVENMRYFRDGMMQKSKLEHLELELT